MGTYNYLIEWAVLPILATIIFSFLRDKDVKNISYKYLQKMYYLAFSTSVVTIITSFFDGQLDSQLDVLGGYIFNTLYFILLPSTAVMYMVYTIVSAHYLRTQQHIKKKIIQMFIPYMIYLLFLLLNIGNGQVFSITLSNGYVRGPLYLLPYMIVGIYLFLVGAIVVKNFKVMLRNTAIVILSSLVVVVMILLFMMYYSSIIATGLVSTTTILIIHFYVINVRRTEDSLLGIQNRIAFIGSLSKKIETDEKFSVYIFSVRGMKQTNDRYGLSTGDKKLCYITNIFLRYVQWQDVFRYSGDEFALLLPYEPQDKPSWVEQLEHEFEKSAEVDGRKIPFNILAVRVDYPSFGDKVQDLISSADYGIQLIKSNTKSGNHYLYDTSVVEKMRNQHAMVKELESAVENHRFVAHFQPIYHIPTGKFTQAEALIRMENQAGKLIFPNDFIELANTTGLVVEMTYQMLEQVCYSFRTLLTQQPDTSLSAVSVNVPYVQFTEPNMEERFMQILDKYDISPKQIKIEITERMLVEDFELMAEKINRLMDKGFEFELDDFGTGYSNLQMGMSFPMEIIKIDRSILLSALSSKSNASFFQHMMEGIKSTGRKTLVEGVETQEQLDWVTECNCEYVQGYFFSKPVNFENFSEFLSK